MIATLNNTIIKNGQLKLINRGKEFEIVKSRAYEEIQNKNYGLKVFQHLLTQPGSEIKSKLKYNDNKYYTFIKPVLKPVLVNHDPIPNQSFKVNSFSTLASVQWHMLSHGLADYWINNHLPYINIEVETTMEEMWRRFTKEVGCKRWGKFDLPEKKTWKNTLKNVQQKLKVYNCHGCYNCIEDPGHDINTFIRCCTFFTKQRNSFLKITREWFVNELQDNGNLNYYKTGKINNKTLPARKHLHLTKKKDSVIYAYVIQKNAENHYDVYRIILKKIMTNTYHQPNYKIVSIYGHMKSQSTDAVTRRINFNINRENHSIITHKCTEIFWQ